MKYDTFTKAQLIAHIERLETNIGSIREQRNQSTFDSGFAALVQQFASELDSDIEGFPITFDDKDSVTGHTSPSNRDIGLKIILANLTQAAHNQIMPYGKNQGAAARLELLRQSRESSGFKDRYAKGELTSDDLRLWKQLNDQQARLNFLSILKDTFQAAYEKHTREAWKPHVAVETRAVKMPKDLTNLRNPLAI